MVLFRAICTGLFVHSRYSFAVYIAAYDSSRKPKSSFLPHMMRTCVRAWLSSQFSFALQAPAAYVSSCPHLYLPVIGSHQKLKVTCHVILVLTLVPLRVAQDNFLLVSHSGVITKRFSLSCGAGLPRRPR